MSFYAFAVCKHTFFFSFVEARSKCVDRAFVHYKQIECKFNLCLVSTVKQL